MNAYRRTFEGQIEQLPAIHDFVDHVAGELGLGNEDALAFRLAADEAAINAFEHGYLGHPGRVEVSMEPENGDLLLSVRNWGAPFDPLDIAEPDLDGPLEQRRAGGLGVFLMRKFMDDVRFSFNAREGNTVTMRRRLREPGQSADSG